MPKGDDGRIKMFGSHEGILRQLFCSTQKNEEEFSPFQVPILIKEKVQEKSKSSYSSKYIGWKKRVPWTGKCLLQMMKVLPAMGFLQLSMHQIIGVIFQNPLKHQYISKHHHHFREDKFPHHWYAHSREELMRELWTHPHPINGQKNVGSLGRNSCNNRKWASFFYRVVTFVSRSWIGIILG